LNYERSNLAVSLNDQLIGGIYFTEESTTLAEQRFSIPPAAVRPGLNTLIVQSNLAPRTGCEDPRQTSAWLTLRAETRLHLPLQPAEVQPPAVLDFKDYPALFAADPTLSQVAFVLAPQDPTGWAVAAQMAFELGDRAGLTVAGLTAVFGDSLPETTRAQKDLIIVGRPSALAALAEMSPAMPAPFEAGSDLAVERNLTVAYRVPAGASVGYVQVFPSPFAAGRNALAVLGNTDQGLEWAGAVVNTPRLRGRLAGVFAVINGEQIVLGQTQVDRSVGNLTATAVPGGELIPTVTGQVPVVERPAWILPTLAVSLTLMAVVLGVVVASARRRDNPSG
jgi:hypothetical protein